MCPADRPAWRIPVPALLALVVMATVFGRRRGAAIGPFPAVVASLPSATKGVRRRSYRKFRANNSLLGCADAVVVYRVLAEEILSHTASASAVNNLLYLLSPIDTN